MPEDAEEAPVYDTDDLVIFGLLKLSERYNEGAARIVVQTTTSLGARRFKKLIFLAIKALRIILHKYDQKLDPQLKALVLLKLANIYYEETNNYDLAEKYANECVNISRRNMLNRYEVMANILLVKVLYETNPSNCSRRLRDLCKQYETSTSLFFILNLLRKQCFDENESGSINFDLETSQKILLADPSIKIYYCLIQALQHLSQSQMNQYLQYLEPVKIFFKNNEIDNTVYNQLFLRLKAMFLLIQLLGALLENDIEKLNSIVQNVGIDFVKIAQKLWTKFDNTLQIPVKVDDWSGNLFEIKLNFEWICKDQFSILFYLLYGMISFYTNGSGQTVYFHYNNLKPLLDRFRQVDEKNLKFSLKKFDNYHRQSLEIKYTSMYYEKWYKFLCGEVNDLNSLKDDNMSPGFQKFLNQKIEYLDILGQLTCLDISHEGNPSSVDLKVDFESVIYKLKALVAGSHGQIKLYAFLQHVNVLNWKLDLAEQNQDVGSAEVLKEIREVLLDFDSFVGVRAAKSNAISGDGFIEFIARNFELQSIILSLVSVYEISSSWNLNLRRWLKSLERAKIPSFFGILLMGLNRSLLSDGADEFSSEINYLTNKINSIHKSKVPLHLETSNMKSIGFYAVNMFRLVHGMSNNVSEDDIRHLNMSVASAYKRIGKLPYGFVDYSLLLKKL